ncbi:MAG TPA: acyl-protein synthetase [Candidatus Paceibacterota bacterium]|nr:acyl-protein synthetase [Candidatus Paceibacterota bacterium]
MESRLAKKPGDQDGDAFKRAPYSADRIWRRLHLRETVIALTKHHYERCVHYQNILDGLNFDPRRPAELAELPFLPVGLFKRLELLSVPRSEVCRTLTSSGTSRAARSRIFLDRETSNLQMCALASIVASLIGLERRPLLIIDAPGGTDDPAGYAARAVAIQGFSLFGAGNIVFALTEKMQPDLEKIDRFLRETQGRKRLLFGFTYVIWRYFLRQLDASLDFANAVLIHGGGWKRLAEEGITDAVFKSQVRERTGLTHIHDYYGMVEQPGSIYMQCEQGLMHCSGFSEIFIRRPSDLSSAAWGEPGLIQTISVLPRSYPGHNVLTEDMGVLQGEDDCVCGRHGKYFKVLGRMSAAEQKGCGDTYLPSS